MVSKQPSLKHVLLSMIFVPAICGVMISCGADLPSSADVENIFNNVLTIQDKMNVVCKEISSDSNLDLSGHIFYKDTFCSEAPSKNVINLNSIVSKEFEYGQNDNKTEDGLFKYGLRLEVYANSGLLEAAQKAVPTLQDLQDSSSAEFSISMIDKLKLDESNFTATAKLEISSPQDKNGSGNIKNRFKLYGKKISNYFIVVIDTYDKVNADTSIMSDAHIAVAIIPHAGDIYVNFIGQFNLFNKGVGGAMDQKLTQMITDTLYDIKQKLN